MKIKDVCNEEEYACLQGDITVSPKQESTSQGNSNESVSSVDSNLRSKCISLDKFCDSFPDCDNQLDEPHGCSQCTKSEKRCRYQIVFYLKRVSLRAVFKMALFNENKQDDLRENGFFMK